MESVAELYRQLLDLKEEKKKFNTEINERIKWKEAEIKEAALKEGSF